MTDPRYPGSGPPYGGGYPPPDPYGQPGQYGGQPNPYGGGASDPYSSPPDQYGSQPGQYGAQPGQYGPPAQYGSQPGQYGSQPGQYGAQQGQYGQPAQYGSPYGSPYGTPGPYDQPSPFGTPPPRKGSGAKVAGIVIGVLVLIVALAIGGLYVIGSNTKKDNTSNAAAPAASAGTSHGVTRASAAPQPKSTDPTDAKIGDCLAGDTMDSSTAKEVKDIRIVRCDAADAKYKVVGVVAGKTESQFNSDDNICDAYPSAVSELWQGRTGEAGSVLCLAPAKK